MNRCGCAIREKVLVFVALVQRYTEETSTVSIASIIAFGRGWGREREDKTAAVKPHVRPAKLTRLPVGVVFSFSYFF